MASKFDSAQQGQLPSTKSTPANGSKLSLFGNKSGFVIPRNKISGSLVPLYRGSGKAEPGESGRDDNNKQLQRKTRWGSDLTQVTSVKRGRSLAYQTRVEQITRQLKSGTLEFDDDRGLESEENLTSLEKFDLSKNREALELEKRELIGEILRLNPNYKAPPDYKPLLKEAKVPISVKSPSGHNIIGIILGAENNTQKRLEEETGAKMQVYGTHKVSKEKREITRSDVSDAQEMYEDLYIHLSADTYEKVDAAASLVELLVTPVFPVPAVAPSEDKAPSVESQSQSQGQSQGESSAVQSMAVPVSLGQLPTQPQIPVHPGQWAPNVPSTGPQPGPYLPGLHQPSIITQGPALQVPRGYPPPAAQSAPQLIPHTRPAQMFPLPGTIPPNSPHFMQPFTSVAQPPLRPTAPVFTMFSPSRAPTQGAPLPQVNSPFQTRPPSFVALPSHPITSPPTAYPRVQVQAGPFPVTSGPPPMVGSANPTFFPLRPPLTSPKPQHPSPGDFTFQPHRAAPPMPSQSPTTPQPPFVPAFRTAAQNPVMPGPRQLPSYVSPPSHAAALIQAHGHHIQGHSPFVPAARPFTLAAAPRPPPGKTDPEYEDLMASVGVK
ncbi:RNA-binding KH domain-containing protein [Wolffia australiana]